MLVTLSGIDGSGKSSTVRKVVRALNARGLVAVSKRPRYATNSIVKRYCQRVHADRYAYYPQFDATFYVSCLLADWLDLLESENGTFDGRIVVTDRYVHDVLAQAITYGAHLDSIVSVCRLFPPASVSLFLDIPPLECHRRLVARRHPPIHRLESLPELERLRDAYTTVMTLLSWSPTIAGNTTAENLADVIALVSAGAAK
ncbi:MAG: hypothetical protein M3O61_15065 [Gemmatimonadota bacterium]|nr:hypothetical protein [Gemmatimonadota bacterium]